MTVDRVVVERDRLLAEREKLVAVEEAARSYDRKRDSPVPDRTMLRHTYVQIQDALAALDEWRNER